MTSKANLVLALSLAGFVLTARAQVTNNPTLPSVPRADGSGPDIPSMSPAVGDAAPPTKSEAGEKSGASTAPSPADLNAAARAMEKPAAVKSSVPPPLLARPPRRPPVPALGRTSVEPRPTESAAGPVNPITTGLNSTALTREMRDLPYEKRLPFLDDLQTRVANSERDFEEVERSSFALKGEARATYRRAFKDLKNMRKALWSTLDEARKASPEKWDNARMELALAYEAYSVALTRAEASSSIGH